jgi:hypothetical protein
MNLPFTVNVVYCQIGNIDLLAYPNHDELNGKNDNTIHTLQKH